MKLTLSSILLVIALVVWWQWTPSPHSDAVATAGDPDVIFNPDNLDPLHVEQQQQESLRAAIATAGEPALTGKITRRPDFVSPFEWQVLKAVARERPDSDQELTRMVNYLRFSKQLESWQTPPDAMTTEQHQQLGWQLLAAIPDRVSQQDLAAHHAQQLQMMLLETLVSDDTERRQYLQREAGRIGVTFDIHSNGY
ncbi:MAG: hypothetical protein ACK4SX_00350 [Alcanivoracaceae bacterium]